MHLRDRHQHAIASGIPQVEVILCRTEDGLGAQPEILTDPVDAMNDVVAHTKIGQRDGNAFLDGAYFDALGRGSKNFAVTQHAEVQLRNSEPRLDRSMIDEHASAAPA